MKSWSRNDKFAFLGVLLAAVGLACAIFGQELRRGLGLDAPQTASLSSGAGSVAGASTGRTAPQAAVAQAFTIRLSGNGNTVGIGPSDGAGETGDREVGGNGAHDSFMLGPGQSARVEMTGNGNTVRVAPKVASRVTVIDNGDANRLVR